jgi:xylulokinase
MGSIVIGVDSSTQSTKAIAWDRQGKVLAEGRCDIPLSNPSLEKFEQNVEDWWDAFCVSCKELSNHIEMSEVDGLAISNQRETLAKLDRDGKAIYPATVWMDKRSVQEVEDLNSAMGEGKIHELTGRPKDPCPCLYRVLWLKNHEREIFDKVQCFADVQAFLVKRLSGEFNTGWISSDPHGMFDVVNKCWSKEILQQLEIDESRLPNSFKPGTNLGKVSKKAAEETGLKEGTPIFAAGGDGQLAGLGTNCTRSDRAYINLGTAVVSGVWSEEYKISKNWRTEIAAHGEGYILENVLLSGALMVNWFVDQFMPGNRKDSNFFSNLENEIKKIPIGSDGLILQPYTGGVMDPYWDPYARGVVVGLSISHTPYHVYKSILEGLTLDSVFRTQNIEKETNLNIKEYLAIGGGANSPAWVQMLADASGKDVLIADTVEASSLGAAMIAAYGAGWYGSIGEAANNMSGKTRLIKPNLDNKSQYDDLIDIYQHVYDSNKKTNKSLVKFAERYK